MNEKDEMIPEEEYEDEALEMVDEEGNTERFYPLATIEYKGARYGIFELAEPESEEDEGCFVFSMEEDGDDFVFNEVEDDELADAVFNLYLQQCEEADEDGGEE